MTLFDDLRASHEVQRSLARTLTNGRASAERRRAAFLALANELTPPPRSGTSTCRC
jgi:hypothetical protein